MSARNRDEAAYPSGWRRGTRERTSLSMRQRIALAVRTAAALGLLLLPAGALAVAPRLEWSFETKGKIYASPIVADLDNDGIAEVIVCVSSERRIVCLDGAGELRWDFRIHDAGGDGIRATPSVVDYDGDGCKEVFFVDTGGVAGNQ